MHVQAVVFATASLMATSAFAAGSVSDVDYLRASRCAGLAAGADDHAAQAADLKAFLKLEGRSRLPYVSDRGEDEMARGRKDARSPDRKDRVAAELAGPCMAFMSGDKNLAARPGTPTP